MLKCHSSDFYNIPKELIYDMLRLFQSHFSKKGYKEMTVFSINPDSIKGYAGTIDELSTALSDYSKELTSVMDDLDSSFWRVKPALSTVIKSVNRQSVNTRALGSTLALIADNYINTENNIVANIKDLQSSSDQLTPTENSSKDGSEAFDDEGTYGGNQNDIKNHPDAVPIYIAGMGKINNLYVFVREHPGYENLTDYEVQQLLEKISENGCGWIAAANMIFAEFEGNPEEFEKLFGFPMYDENGNLNYDQLVVDMYLSEQGQYHVGDDSPYGKAALLNAIYGHYDMNRDEFKQKYGIDLYDANGNVSDEAYDKLIEERDALIADSDGETVYYENDPAGTTPYSNVNRIDHYLKEKGIDTFTYDLQHDPYTNQEIQDALDSGKTVYITAEHFNLYDENGNRVETNVGTHAMVVTGITEDGKYIVSSWGEKYIFDPNETQPNGQSTILASTTLDIYDEAA